MKRLAICALLMISACRDSLDDSGKTDDTGKGVAGTDGDGDGFASGVDCNDADPAIHPEARELCDGIDNDCDGLFDDEDSNVFGANTWYPDYDLDGYGEDRLVVEACEQPAGYVDNDLDCLDTNGDVHLDADEICDGIDNDCDGVTDGDDATDAHTWYIDEDADGYGTDDSTVSACDPPAGYALHDNDCDDSDPSFHPGALETDCTDENDYNCDGSVGFEDGDSDGFAACEDCDDADANANDDAAEICDGVDNDCDGLTDSDDPDTLGTTTFYADADGDGYGGQQFTLEACEASAGYVTSSDDCDDLDAASHPGAAEICDDRDNDCDTDIDEGVGTSWYEDSDSDGYGNGSVSVVACDAPGGYVGNALDCDDFSATTNPAAYEICDGADNDCDGSVDEDAINATTWYVDGDGDGYGTLSSTTEACDQPTGYAGNASDCDDAATGVNPDAAEVCDSTDNNCDGSTDEGVTTAYYADTDGDGYGDASSSVDACSLPATGYVADATDCDDTAAASYPGNPEVCDGTDNNCDGTTDEEVTTTYYADSDGDGYGDAASSVEACSMPASGYVTDDEDCDDSATGAAIYPGATDTWYDGVDSDCDGASDYDQDGDGYDAVASGGIDTNDTDASCWDACPDGSTQAKAHTTCGTLLADIPTATDGVYWMDTDADGDTSNAFQVYCDMANGGWTYQSNGSPWSFAYTGGTQTLTTSGVSAEYLFYLYGGAGGFGYNNGGPGGCGGGSQKGGLGGQATGSKTFSAGTSVVVEVGGQGTTGLCADHNPGSQQYGGYNGGGRGSQGGSGGGGATDIRVGGSSLSDRILVAGGGGGCGHESCICAGGDGGGVTGADGGTNCSSRGYGGDQSSGGGNANNNSSAYGTSGAGGDNVQTNDEGGGGGGWYGGSAGGGDNAPGGGGSSYYDGMDGNQSTNAGVNSSHGYVDYVYR